MASAQVMPNSAVSSRKQELLDAGKRRLEEFRKQKAAGRSKKAGSAIQPPTADSVANEKLHSNGKIHVPQESKVVVANDAENLNSKTSKSAIEPKIHTYSDPTVPKSQISVSSDVPLAWTKQEEQQRTNVSGSGYPVNIEFGLQKYEKIDHYGTISIEGRSWDMASSDQYNDFGHLRTNDAQSNISDASKEIPGAGTSYAYSVDNVSSGRSSTALPQSNSDFLQSTLSTLLYASDFGQSAGENSDFNKHVMSERTERKHIYDDLPSLHRVAIEDSQTSSKVFNFSNDSDFSRQACSQSVTLETYPRKSHPSFLDSLDIPSVASTSGFSNSQPQLVPGDVAASASHDHFGGSRNLESQLEGANSHGNYNANSFPDRNLYVNHVERNLDLPQKQNGDFDALEQHIEDLTQGKFSLQRALEASKSLAESLAAENSSLTESYLQGSLVAQLKSEMESLQAQIKALLAEHESIRIQYENAQLECNAADERTKLLASEVIGLEEKVLRLRSNELKLEKELEKSRAGVASCKKTMLCLEKERQDLQITIDALQEEKKLLQSKLQTASTSWLLFDNDERKSKNNVSTSTDDLEVLHGHNALLSPPIEEEHHASASLSPHIDNLDLLQQNGGLGFDGSATIIPSDHVLIIQNINALLSELMSEKEELSQALVAEISTSSKLMDLNKELSQRLDAQILRLELLTAQSMAKDNVVARQPTDSQIRQENMAYADEGDEVVERVLGWVMKLFPGGPSKRITSKLI